MSFTTLAASPRAAYACRRALAIVAVLRGDLEGALVAIDRAVAIAAGLEQARGADPLFGLRRGGRRGRGQRFDGRERRARVARLLAKARERLESSGVSGLLLENALVHERRLIGRPDVVRDHARLLHQELDPARLVVRDRRVLLVEIVQVLPPPQGTAMPLELRERSVVVGIEREDELEALGRARVVEELLVVQRSHALVEVDLLSRRRRDLDLLLEVGEELAVLARAVVDAIEALEGGHVVALDFEHRLEAPLGLAQVAELVLVELGDLEQRLGLLAALGRLGALLEDARERLVVARALGDPGHSLRGLGVARVLDQHLGVRVAARGWDR